MNAMNREDLWQRLQQQGLVEGDMPLSSTSSAPWYVRVMMGAAGWIGALFLLGFVGAGFAFVMKSAAASMLLGALCCGAAFAVFRAARDNDFASQFGLAISLAGQAMFIAGVFNAARFESAGAYVAIAVFEAVLAGLMPNAIHRTLAAGGAMLALAFALERLGMQFATPAIAAVTFVLVWLDVRRWAIGGAVWRPVGYGLALALLLIESMRLFDSHGFFWTTQRPGMPYGGMIGSLLTTAVLLWATLQLLAREKCAPSSGAGSAALLVAVLASLLSVAAPGLASALLILLLGVSCGNRILIGLGLCGLLGFVSHYYYQLQSTLLVKSAVLAATGLALLAARLALHRSYPQLATEEKIHEAHA